jgi:putative ABC transport system substrate-binding protein
MRIGLLRRREFITLLGGTAAWPLVARAQQAERMRRIGLLMASAADDPVRQARSAAFQHGLAQDFGFTARLDVVTQHSDEEDSDCDH